MKTAQTREEIQASIDWDEDLIYSGEMVEQVFMTYFGERRMLAVYGELRSRLADLALREQVKCRNNKRA